MHWLQSLKGFLNKPSKHSTLSDPIVLQSLKLLGSLMKNIQQMLPNTPLPTLVSWSSHDSADHMNSMNFPEF